MSTYNQGENLSSPKIQINVGKSYCIKMKLGNIVTTEQAALYCEFELHGTAQCNAIFMLP